MGARDNKIEIHYIEAKVCRIPTLILTLVKQYYTCSLDDTLTPQGDATRRIHETFLEYCGNSLFFKNSHQETLDLLGIIYMKIKH